MALTIDRLRRQVRLDADFTEDDADLLGYAAAAQAHVEQHCDRVIVDGSPASDNEMRMTPDLEQAILLLVGHWYANREAVVVGATSNTVPMAVTSLLWPRKRF